MNYRRSWCWEEWGMVGYPRVVGDAKVATEKEAETRDFVSIQNGLKIYVRGTPFGRSQSRVVFLADWKKLVKTEESKVNLKKKMVSRSLWGIRIVMCNYLLKINEKDNFKNIAELHRKVSYFGFGWKLCIEICLSAYLIWWGNDWNMWPIRKIMLKNENARQEKGTWAHQRQRICG